MRRFRISLAGSVAAALLCAPAALAQSEESGDSPFVLEGASFLNSASVDETAISINAEMLAVAADARTEARPEGSSESEDGLQAVTPLEDTGAPTAQPWYERFTMASPSHMPSPWGEQAAEFEIPAGDRWGFTLGYSEPAQGPQFDLDDMRAGAFFELGDRFRFGGQFRFTSPERDMFGEDSEEQSPEIKFESAFRF